MGCVCRSHTSPRVVDSFHWKHLELRNLEFRMLSSKLQEVLTNGT